MGQSNVVESASRGGGVDPEQVRGAVEAEITRLASRLAVGDGALGFWAALDEIYPQTRQQRCWMHETVNVLNKLSKGAQPKAMQVLHEMWQAKTREDAHGAFTLFLDMYEDKYPKATECLEQDHEELLAFYDFPVAHWRSLLTTNPIESLFAMIRRCTVALRLM